MSLQPLAPVHLAAEARVSRVIEGWSSTMERLGPGSWMMVGRNGSRLALSARIDSECLYLRVACVPAMSLAVDAHWSLLGLNGGFTGGAKIALDTPGSGPFLCADVPLNADIDLVRRVRQACDGLEQAAALLGASGLPVISDAFPVYASITREASEPPADVDLVGLCQAAQWTGVERNGAVTVDLGLPDMVCHALLQVRSGGRIAASVDLNGDPVGDDGPPPVCRRALAMLLLRVSGSVRMARATVAGGTPRIEVVFDDTPAPVELGDALAALSVACRLTVREAGVLSHNEHVARSYLERTAGLSTREDEPTLPGTKARPPGTATIDETSNDEHQPEVRRSNMEAAMTLGLQVSDVSGQKVVKASSVPLSSSIGELVDGLLAKMGLARIDAQGRPLNYYARLEREGRHLNGSETVGDALQEGDELTLTPNIDAGAR